MSQVSSPYGLRVTKVLGDLPFSGGMMTYPLTVNNTSGLFFGDPVGLIGGQPVAIAATPTTALSANTPVGVMMGASWQDPIRGFVNAQYLPPNALNNGATNIMIKIADWPYLVFAVQATGPVLLNQIGMNAALTNFAAGSLTTGNSQVQLLASSIAGTATLAVKIYSFVNTPTPSPGAGSQPGDPFTDCLVIWNAGVHRWMNGGGQ